MLNETPNPSPKKTKSEPNPTATQADRRDGRRLLILVAVVVLLYIGAYLLAHSRHPAGDTVILRAASAKYSLEVATTPAKQSKGLGARSGLAAGTGMLFPYKTEKERCFWMKDMRFNIDIIWVGADQHIKHIEPNLAPATFPDTFCFDAQDVIELDAGEAARLHLQDGQHLDY